MGTSHALNAHFPVRSNLKPAYILSLIIAILMGVASAAGLLRTTTTYPTDKLFRAFTPNDVVNILIGLPILLGSL